MPSAVTYYYSAQPMHFLSGVDTQRSLIKDTPLHRPIERLGIITSRPILGGLHHQYFRI